MAPRIVAINSNPDVLEALRETFVDAGFRCDLGHVRDLRTGKASVEDVLGPEQVDAILFDIAPPMEENWECYERFERHPRVRAIPTVLTTTNRAELSRVAAGRPAVEVLLKPFDVHLLLQLMEVATGRKRDEQLWIRWFPDKPAPT